MIVVLFIIKYFLIGVLIKTAFIIVLVINLVFSSVVYNMSYIFAINAENLYLIRQRICGEDTDIYNAAKPSDPLSTATSKEISQ